MPQSSDLDLLKLQACLYEVGFTDVRVAPSPTGQAAFFHSYSRAPKVRLTIWKATAVVHPFDHVCWGCFQKNGRVPNHAHCGTCECCTERNL